VTRRLYPPFRHEPIYTPPGERDRYAVWVRRSGGAHVGTVSARWIVGRRARPVRRWIHADVEHPTLRAASIAAYDAHLARLAREPRARVV
jgi:hypothetical protein